MNAAGDDDFHSHLRTHVYLSDGIRFCLVRDLSILFLGVEEMDVNGNARLVGFVIMAIYLILLKY